MTRSHWSLLATPHASDASPRQPSVDLKRRPPKSRPGRLARKVSFARQAARKDSAVHVSLSSDSPVKQPEPQRAWLCSPSLCSPSSPAREIFARRSPPFDAAARTWPREHGRMLGHRVNSEGLRRRAIAPRRRRAEERIYRRWPPFLSTISDRREAKKWAFFAASDARPNR